MARKLTEIGILTFSMLFVGALTNDIPFKEKFFDQTLDHYNFYTKTYGQDTYKQRYLVQDKWWAEGYGPIFFYTGNEGNVESFWNNSGFIFDIAPEFKALVIFAEHRFYGKSVPFGADSFKHPNVDLLTVEQALADFATLLDHLKTTLKATDCPVISFGGSYGGMLSAYFRIKYPNLVEGALAASAPVVLISQQIPRNFFFEDVSKDFKNAVSGCDDKVRQAFIKMNQLASQGAKGYEEISKKFKLCKPLSNEKSYFHLLGWIRNSFTILAMLDYPYPTDFLSPLPAYPVKSACHKIVGSSDLVSGLAQAAEIYYGSPSCFDIDKEFIECSDPTGCGTGPDGLAWDYQACTELLMPAGTDNKTDIFPVLPFTVTQREEYCQKTWGVTPRNDWMRINMWGNDLSHTSNIIFSNGNLDPWHRGGILDNVSDSIIALMVEGGAHHLDLRGANADDPPSVKEVRNTERKYISKWVEQSRKKKTLHYIDNIIHQFSEL